MRCSGRLAGGYWRNPPWTISTGSCPIWGNARVFAIEYLPGQYDQRADSAAQCIQILTHGNRPLVRTAQVIALAGNLSEEAYERIKAYCVNPVEARFASLETPKTLEIGVGGAGSGGYGEWVYRYGRIRSLAYREEMGFAMDDADIVFCQGYFRDTERRVPTVAELRMIDTYWSDHCRPYDILNATHRGGVRRGDRGRCGPPRV